MSKIQHYVTGQWTEGKEEGMPVLDAITGEVISNIATTDWIFLKFFSMEEQKVGKYFVK